ncbi:MAG: hypothetical protein AAFN50_03000 [Pseudomonadota bacterium]
MRPHDIDFSIDDLDVISDNALRHLLDQQRHDERRWANGGKMRPLHRRGWEDDDFDGQFDDYSNYDDYDADEFDSYTPGMGSLSG